MERKKRRRRMVKRKRRTVSMAMAAEPFSWFGVTPHLWGYHLWTFQLFALYIYILWVLFLLLLFFLIIVAIIIIIMHIRYPWCNNAVSRAANGLKIWRGQAIKPDSRTWMRQARPRSKHRSIEGWHWAVWWSNLVNCRTRISEHPRSSKIIQKFLFLQAV